MKEIVPFQTWANGQQVEAKYLQVNAQDNLSNSASFNYYIYAGEFETLTQVSNGSLLMTGEDYDNWQTNDYAYDWVANKLNLQFI